MSGFEYFATGFFDALGEGITKRKDAANDYFARQMERAGTTGVKALQARRDTLRQVTSVANNLKVQANMPDDVLRGLINEGPETLDQSYQLYADSVANGVEVDEDFWKNVYKFSNDIKPSDEPLSVFLERAVGLYPSNLQSTKSEGGDPFSAFVASGFGYNAMERANERLGNIEVAEGYSASELNAMTDAGSTRPLGDTGLTVDLEEISRREAAAQAEVGGLTTSAAIAKPLSPSAVKPYMDLFNASVEEQLQSGWREGVERTPEVMDAARQIAAAELLSMFGPNDLQRIPNIAKYLPVAETEITTTPIEEMGVTTTPIGPNDPPITSQIAVPNKIQMGDSVLVFTGEEGADGYSFEDEFGNIYAYSAEELGLVDTSTPQEMSVPDGVEEEFTSDASQRLGADFDSIMAGESNLHVNPSFGAVPSLNPGEDPPESFTTEGKVFNFVGVQELQDQAYAVYEDETGKELYVLIQEE